jgi:hypothetical protein
LSQKPGGIEPKNKLSETSARFKVLGSLGKTDSMLLRDKSRVCKRDKCKKESLATNVSALSLRSTEVNSDGSFGRGPDTPVDEILKKVRSARLSSAGNVPDSDGTLERSS